jgi:hypothetical protein
MLIPWFSESGLKVTGRPYFIKARFYGFWGVSQASRDNLVVFPQPAGRWRQGAD